MTDAIHSPREEESRVVSFPRPREVDPPESNLPLQLSSFVGRDAEVAEVGKLLAGGRLVTLTGAGGSGKTRLALAAAFESVADFEDGVWWVELAPLSDPNLTPRTVASALEVREAAGRSTTDILAEHLKMRKALLVLDNCEHLIEACAALADPLLRACPGLRILATSREPLGISGESSYPVPPLSAPDPDRIYDLESVARHGAVRLFVERARAVVPGFALTEENSSALARVCRALDGMPLAIELAAARVKVLSVEQISEKLEDPLGLLTTGSRSAAPRHRALRATLEWSHDLLSDEEKTLFRRLSVFVGGWTLEAAEAVGRGGAGGGVLDPLSKLVDKSLVAAEADAGGAPRYGFLEPVRQYGLERLGESGEEAEVRRRHAEHYLAFAETAEPELMGIGQPEWLRRLRTEFGNLRGAFSWSMESGEVGEGLRLAAALWRFWGAEGFEEGKRWLRTSLEKDSGGFPAIRAKALGGLGFILLFQQDYERAIVVLEEAISLNKGLRDSSGGAISLGNLGYAVLHGGFHERVPAFVREAEALMAGDLDGHARAFLGAAVACAAIEADDLDSAVFRLEESLALCRELGDLRQTSMSLFILGIAELTRGDLDRGVSLLEEGARIAWELGDRRGSLETGWADSTMSGGLGR